MKIRKVSCIAMLSISFNVYAAEEEITVLSFQGDNFTAEDIVEGLTDTPSDLPPGLLPKNTSGKVKYRGIVLKRPKKSSEVIKEQTQQQEQMVASTSGSEPACPVMKKAIAVSINFAVNSYDITSSAMGKLDQIAKAMNNEKLLGCRFVVEGHTDATGGADYNLALSNYRAQAVKNYLTNQSIKSGRLYTVGKGENEPLDQNNPNAAVNRRVQFTVGQ